MKLRALIGFLFAFGLASAYADTFIAKPALHEGVTGVTVTGVTTQLTVLSETVQHLMGATSQVVALPQATTLKPGRYWVIRNDSSQSVAVRYFGGSALSTVRPATSLTARLKSAVTSDGDWTLETQDFIRTGGDTMSGNLGLAGAGTAPTTVVTMDANRVLQSSAVTPTELAHLVGVSGNVQTQLNAKVNRAADTMTGPLGLDYATVTPDRAAYVDGAKVLRTSTTVSSQELEYLDGVTSNLGARVNQFTDIQAGYLGGVTTSLISQLGGVTSNIGAKLNLVTATEMDYLAGVTADIQTQINAGGGGGGSFVSKTGDSMSGALQVGANVTSTGTGRFNLLVSTNDVQSGIASSSAGVFTACSSSSASCATIQKIGSEFRLTNPNTSTTNYVNGDERTALTSSAFRVTNVTTSSSSKDTGAFIVENGGAGIEGNMYAGGFVSAGTGYLDASTLIYAPSGVTSYVIPNNVSTFIIAPTTEISTTTVTMPTGATTNQLLNVSCSGLNGITSFVHLPTGGQTLDNPLTSCSNGSGGSWIYNAATGAWRTLLKAQVELSEIFVSGANGYGSTNTKIRRWATINFNRGPGITITQSSTNGDSLTANEAGLYGFTYCDQFSAAANMGVTLNTTQPTVSIQSLSDLNEAVCRNVSANTDVGACCSMTMRLSSGAVIRAHTDGTGAGGNTWMPTMRMTKISN